MWSRIHLIPLLTAEEDRDLVRRHLADQAREKDLLGSNSQVYNSDRYITPPFTRTAIMSVGGKAQLENPTCGEAVSCPDSTDTFFQICSSNIRRHTSTCIQVDRQREGAGGAMYICSIKHHDSQPMHVWALSRKSAACIMILKTTMPNVALQSLGTAVPLKKRT
jgi:hypothetical protein